MAVVAVVVVVVLVIVVVEVHVAGFVSGTSASMISISMCSVRGFDLIIWIY